MFEQNRAVLNKFEQVLKSLNKFDYTGPHLKKFEQDQTCMIYQKNCAIHRYNWQGGKHPRTRTRTEERE